MLERLLTNILAELHTIKGNAIHACIGYIKGLLEAFTKANNAEDTTAVCNEMVAIKFCTGMEYHAIIRSAKVTIDDIVFWRMFLDSPWMP